MKILKLIILTFLIQGCSSASSIKLQQNLDGIYYSENGSKITIDKDKFELIKNTGWNTIIKTSVSDGTVKLIENNVLEFNSHSQLNKYGNGELKLNIDEYRDANSKGLKIQLLDFDNINYKILDIEFNARVTVGISELANYNLDDLKKNDFLIKIDKDIETNTFVYVELIMFSKCIPCASPKTNTLYEYEFFSEGSNIINLKLEKDTNLFNYLFLKKDYAILNNKEIFWDGLTYEKVKE
jgi:hypothetical protein